MTQGEKSAVPPEFPNGHFRSYNGQTRTSLLQFRKRAPGRQLSSSLRLHTNQTLSVKRY